MLSSYLDKLFADFIINGIRYSFKIGCTIGQSSTAPTLPRNRVASPVIKETISGHITVEAAAGRLLPAVGLGLAMSRFSPINAIPKKGKPGHWRVITDLSFPTGASVNDGIPQMLTSLSYASVWDAARIMHQIGKGALFSKLDLYRMIPIQPSDLHLMGIHWEGTQCADAALPFGLRLAPKSFN